MEPPHMMAGTKTKRRGFGLKPRGNLLGWRPKDNRTGKVLLFLIVLCGCLSVSGSGFLQEVSPPVKSVEVQAKPQQGKIVAGPRNIKERTAVYVFLGWMWGSVAVLVYFLTLKIKEADRLYSSRFFSPSKK
jgi:hypothetical protein